MKTSARWCENARVCGGLARAYRERNTRGDSQTVPTFCGSWRIERQFWKLTATTLRLRDAGRKYFIARYATTLMAPTRWTLNIMIYERVCAYRLLNLSHICRRQALRSPTSDKRLIILAYRLHGEISPTSDVVAT